jgi:hypothetical protein
VIAHYATLPDGTIEKRSSSRRFTHAVAVRPTFDARYLAAHVGEQSQHDRWQLAGFCGSLRRAESLARDIIQRYARRTQDQVHVDIKIVRVRAAPDEISTRRSRH